MNKDVYLIDCDCYQYDIVMDKLKTLLLDNNLLSFVKPKMTIGIKVNLVSAMKPDKHATTNPILVKALCKILNDLDCKCIVGDSPGGLFTESFLKGVYKETLMTSVVSDNTILNNDFTTSTVDVNLHTVKCLDTSQWLRKCDAIINVCKLKSHGMMGLSCATKNMFGSVPGILKPEYHYRYPNHDDFANMLIDINEYYKPSLNLVDAIWGMEGNGPTQGDPRFIGLLLASDKPYNLDIICAKIIGINIDEVGTIRNSIKRGLAKANIDDISVNNDYTNYLIKDFKNIPPGKDMTFTLKYKGPFKGTVNKAMKHILTSKPNVLKHECIGCKKCYNICPVKAITMKNNLPHINRKICIRCFCCQEFCPIGAMKTKKNIIVRILTK